MKKGNKIKFHDSIHDDYFSIDNLSWTTTYSNSSTDANTIYSLIDNSILYEYNDYSSSTMSPYLSRKINNINSWCLSNKNMKKSKDIFGHILPKQNRVYLNHGIPWKHNGLKTVNRYFYTKESNDYHEIPWNKNKRNHKCVYHYIPFNYSEELQYFSYKNKYNPTHQINRNRRGWVIKKSGRIPWNHVRGEKNPINTWNLPDDFYDKEIEMPTDGFFLRSEERQHGWQLGIN